MPSLSFLFCSDDYLPIIVIHKDPVSGRETCSFKPFSFHPDFRHLRRTAKKEWKFFV